MAHRLLRHPTSLHLGLVLVLTFPTGVIDTVRYPGRDRVLTGNVTGNVVILAMAITGAVALPTAGLAFDSRFGHNARQQWPHRALAGILNGAGALLLDVHFGLGTALSATITLMVALVGRPHLAPAARLPPPSET